MIFESFFSGDYTLKKLSTEAYIRDPRFEAHGCAVKMSPDLPARWWSRDELPEFFAEIDWSDAAIICHHAQFDGLILSHHYNVHPKFWFCTLSMARLLLGNHISVSLDSVRKQFNLPAKITPYNLFKGKRWHELDRVTQGQVGEGACDEVESIWKLFNILGKDFPREEFEVVDNTVKMFTEPVLRGDVELLSKIWMDEEKNKNSRMAKLWKRICEIQNIPARDFDEKAKELVEANLQSAGRFAQLLRAEGAEIAMKDGKNKQIYAFAKVDQFMRDLLESENERIRTLAEARLGVKSTIMQTRAETLGWMARRGPLAVYLNYAGAGTLRPSGGDGSNFLNLKRSSPIRPALKAPEGYLLGPIDASQIECRVLHYLAGGPDEPVIQKFRNNEDPYVDIATQYYNEPIYKPKANDPRKTEMESKRGLGKQARLMCGYGSGPPKFRSSAKNGLYGPPIDIPLEEAMRFVWLYREQNPSVCGHQTGYWSICNFRMLPVLAAGRTEQFGPLTIKDHRIYLPNGAMMIYDTLEWHIPAPDEENVREFERDGFWRLKTRSGWKKMWGAKLTQHICEAVSRVIVSQAMIRIKHMGFRTLNWPYDELLLLFPNDGRAEENMERCRQEMIREVPWLPGLPLDAEGSLGERYSK